MLLILILNTVNIDTTYCWYWYEIRLIPILNTIDTDAKYYQYRSNILFHCYATFLRLRRECHTQNLLETTRNLDQFLSKSDAIWSVSDQFEVFTYLGGGPLLTVIGVLSNNTNTITTAPKCSLIYSVDRSTRSTGGTISTSSTSSTSSTRSVLVVRVVLLLLVVLVVIVVPVVFEY
jgi:uncharacterized protein with NAD-binding domain and iron-sulfur cluster